MPTSPQRQARLYAIKAHIEAHILKLTEEINIMLDHPVGVAGKESYLGAIEDLMSELADYEGMLTAYNRFNPNGK